MINYFCQISTDKAIDRAADQITKASIDLAEATANYGALKVVFGIFMVFMIIIVILFIYQIFALSQKIGNIYTAAIKTQEYFEGVSDRTVGESQANVIIRRSMTTFSQTIKYYIIRMRLENHLDDKEATKVRITRLIKNEYSELRSFLSQFLCNEQQLSDIVDDEDVDIIVDFIIEQVYFNNTEFSVSGMDQSTDILINGIKLTYLKKIS